MKNNKQSNNKNNYLAISREASLLAKSYGFKLTYNPYKLKTFRETYSHLLKTNPKAKIYLINNYRGNLKSVDGKYIMNGKSKNPGATNLHMFLPHLVFEKNLILVTPPLDINWIHYLNSIKIYPKTFDVTQQILPIKLAEMDASPIDALLKDGHYKQIPYKSLLITTFNDISTKNLIKKRKSIHNQTKINSYEGNSKINQREDLLPMPPSIIVHNKQETIKAIQNFIRLGVKNIWIKCGNNVGSGQFMKAISLQHSKKSLKNVIDSVAEIHQEQSMLMNKTVSQPTIYTNAEIMLEVDIRQLGNILLEGSIHFICESDDRITICEYVRQLKDSKDSSKSIGGANFIPRKKSLEVLFPVLMQQIVIHAANRQRKRNYASIVGVDLFIVEMTKDQYKYYISLIEQVGLLPERIPTVFYKNKVIIAILGEINERESFIPPVKRIALNLHYKYYISTTLSNLPDRFDFNNLKELVKRSKINIPEVIPLTRKIAGLRNGIPYYNGIPASFYIGIFSNKNDIEKKYKRLLAETEKIKSISQSYEEK